MKFFLFILSFSVFSEITEISPQTFNKTILPSLKKLVQDYYFLLSKLDPYNQEIIFLKKNAIALEHKWHEFKISCNQKNDRCNQDLSKINTEFRALNDRLLKMEGEFKISKNLNSKVLVTKTINTISDDFHKTLILLNFFKYQKKDFFHISDQIKNIKLNLNVLATGLLSEDYEDNFYFIYSNFFKMLENDIIERSNIDLFKREVANLNISWNNFNMKAPKWKTSLPGDTPVLLESMHKRWNSILKTIWGK